MTSITKNPPKASPSELLLNTEVLIDAPREEVWEKMQRPEFWVECFSDDGYSAELPAQDMRDGGTFRFTVETLGMEFQFRCKYIAVKEPESLELSSIWENVDQDDEEETRYIYTFTPEDGNKTRLRINHYGLKTITIHDFYKEFWDHYLKTLAEFCERT